MGLHDLIHVLHAEGEAFALKIVVIKMPKAVAGVIRRLLK